MREVLRIFFQELPKALCRQDKSEYKMRRMIRTVTSDLL